MKSIAQLIEALDCHVVGPTDVGITDIVFDSRKVTQGALFAASKGVHTDGRLYVKAALEAGAKAILSVEPLEAPGATVIQVHDFQSALAHVAVRFWDFPSTHLRMVGITGTNGKTTISYIVESIFKAAGIPSGVLGTINYRFGEDVKPAPNTTPLASELQRFLAHVVSKGGKACVMEVSSHALALGRVQGVDFDAAVFTNLTQDHLDFHGTMDAYAAAKMRLFQSLDPESKKEYSKTAIINMDDPWAEKMRAQVRVPVLGYRLHHGDSAEVYAAHIESDATGSRFILYGPGVQRPVRLPLLGDYNIMNALAAAAVGFSQKIPLDKIVQGLETIAGVPGRMERVVGSEAFTVVVDYAHTEDALRKVLTALRRLHPSRIITVFGCGGDRDRAKRPLMGEAAAQLSEKVIVTSDNPRSEDPSRITLDIEVGVRRVRADRYEIILDREAAIAQAIQRAQPVDIILIAGKGHENYQILADRTLPFDDREVAHRLLTKIPS
jgi:UDP-N-acetylmuramoyl-L-alanyl-D-glutamate--2,6-diaminopimelate ligase